MGTALHLTRQQVREVDRLAIERYGIPGVVLMENAAAGAARLALDMDTGPHRSILIACGGGNNGGDGYAMARHLSNAGCDVHIVAHTPLEELQGDARINALIAARMGISMHSPEELGDLLGRATMLVDALLGTGFQVLADRPLREPMRSMIARLANERPPLVLAVDLPSGMDADTGETCELVIPATKTVTFVAQKVGFQNPAAKPLLGEVQVVDIGVPRSLIAEVAHSTP